MTSDNTAPKLSLWPFFLVDAMFIGAAVLIYNIAHRPILWWEATLLVACVVGAAWSILFPLLRRDSARQSMAQTENLSQSVAQINKLEQLAGQIANATAQWQSVQEYALKVADSSKELSKSVSAETQAFAEFMKKANDAEKAHLRLEVEKLHRGEFEWLQVLTRILDHVYALHVGAVRSGQANLIEQISQFQSACLDACRRVGLVPLLATPNEPFNAELHQLPDTDTPPAGEAIVVGTLVTGYRFQGRLIRRAVVALQAPSQPEPAAPVEEPAAPAAQEPAPAPAPAPAPKAPFTGELGLE